MVVESQRDERCSAGGLALCIYTARWAFRFPTSITVMFPCPFK